MTWHNWESEYSEPTPYRHEWVPAPKLTRADVVQRNARFILANADEVDFIEPHRIAQLEIYAEHRIVDDVLLDIADEVIGKVRAYLVRLKVRGSTEQLEADIARLRAKFDEATDAADPGEICRWHTALSSAWDKFREQDYLRKAAVEAVKRFDNYPPAYMVSMPEIDIAWFTGDWSAIFPGGVDCEKYGRITLTEIAVAIVDETQPYRLVDQWLLDVGSVPESEHRAAYVEALRFHAAGLKVDRTQALLGCDRAQAERWADIAELVPRWIGIELYALPDDGTPIDVTWAKLVSEVDFRESLQATLAATSERLKDHPYHPDHERELVDMVAQNGLTIYHGTADIVRYRERDCSASICYAVERWIAERYGRRAAKHGKGATGHKMTDDHATLVTARIPAGAKIATTKDLERVLTDAWSQNGRYPVRYGIHDSTWEELDRDDVHDLLRAAGFDHAIIRDGCESDYLAIRALTLVDDVEEDML